MASKKVGLTIHVYPRTKGDCGGIHVGGLLGEYTPKELERQGEEIIRDIRRHIDDISGANAVYDFACEHCGANWTERSHHYNGGCCDADEANNPNPEPGDVV